MTDATQNHEQALKTVFCNGWSCARCGVNRPPRVVRVQERLDDRTGTRNPENFAVYCQDCYDKTIRDH